MCELLTAVREGKKEKTKELLEWEFFYNLPSWNQGQGIVLLREALARGHCEIAQLLLCKGARVNNKFGNPINDPLHFAVGLPGKIEIVRLLLNEGAKINASNSDGCTPLHLAIFANNEPIVKLLLENQADLDTEDNFRSTPLHVAVQNGFENIAELLLTLGAKPDVPLANGFSPLHLACQIANYNMVCVLVKHGADLNASSSDGTPLDLALPEGKPDCVDHRISIVSTLLAAGAKVNSIDNAGKTVLHRAVEIDSPDLVAIVLKYANVNSLSFDVNNKCLQTPIQIAAQKGFAEIIDLLITHGADIHMPCNTLLGGCYTPLHLACSYGHMSIVERLLKRGADLEVKTLEGRTPLHTTVCHFGGNAETLLQTVQLLLDNGAEIFTKDQDNSTIIHDAVEKNNLFLVNLILQHVSSLNVELKLFVNAQNALGFTPLHIAARNGDVIMAEFLLNHGAEVGTVSNFSEDGFTPLHIASKHLHIETIKLFLGHGANANSLSVLGQTPCHVALSFPDNFSHRQCPKGLSVVKLLLERGANLDTPDKNGDTILNLSVKLRCLKVVQAILEYKPDITSPYNKAALKAAVITGTKFSDDVFCDFSFNLRIGAVKENRCIINELFQYGLVFNDEDLSNNEVLHHAIRKGYLSVVQYFLEHGADFKALSDLGTPLHSAVSMLQEDIIKLLLSLKVKINAKDMSGKTPLYYITEKLEKMKIFRDFGDSQKCFDVAKELLSNGADLADDSRFLIVATLRGSKELVEMALKCNADVNVVGQNGCTALHAAVLAKDKYLVSILLQHGAEINAVDNDFQTPLLIAVSQQHEAISNLLLDNKADVNVKDKCHMTPLHFAAMWNHVEIIERLLKLGAAVDSQTKNLDTPLHLAADKACSRAVVALLRGGATANAKRKDEATALHLAAEWPDENVVENLLYFGADPRSRTISNATPLACSLQKHHPKVVRLLLENGGYTNDMCCSISQSYRWFASCKRNIASYEMLDVIHLHFLDFEVGNSWPQENSCFCHAWICSNVIIGNKDEEIEKLKSTFIIDGVNFHSLLSKQKSQLVSLARNKSICESLATVDFLKEFPIFGKLLNYRWQSAVSREKLLSTGVVFFNLLMVESIVTRVNQSPHSKLLEILTSNAYGWLLQFLKLTTGTNDSSEISASYFTHYIRQVHSLLPTDLLEKIVNHLSDNDLQNLAGSGNSATNRDHIAMQFVNVPTNLKEVTDPIV